MAFQFLGLDHVQLAAPAGAEEAARHFFGEILGMEEIPKPAELVKRGGVWFRCGDHALHIGIEQDFQPAKKAHPGFSVRDLKGLQQRLTAYGIAYVEDDLVPGNRRLFTQDPFGNRLEFLEWGVE